MRLIGHDVQPGGRVPQRANIAALLLVVALPVCGSLVRGAHAQTIEVPSGSQQKEGAAAADQPLPNLKTLLDRAKAHSDAAMEIRKNYTCKQTVVADELDSHGNKKGTHKDEYQMFYVRKYEISQHLSHDGQPLKPEDAKKEQERVDKRIADIKAGNVKESKGFALRVSDLLKMSIVSEPKREMLNGRPTIFFDYRGNPDVKAEGLPQEVMKKIAGTVEVDEQDAYVVRLTGTLVENFHIMGGMLVNLKKGSHFEVVSARVNDELWFTKLFVGHVDGRLLLFKGFDGDMHAEFSDYRKMKTSATLLPGSQVIGEDGKPIPNIEAEPETGAAAAPLPAPK